MPKKINVDKLSVAAIRATCIDGINNANSGHPGVCLSLAPAMYVLFKDYLLSNPFKPDWINRDRLVLSCGHGSMLLYTILHLAGYGITIDDLKNFRKVDSITPGHPEYGVTQGVDAGSGPLGQGIAEAVGMALAETNLNSIYGNDLINHYTYCFCGDGCLEEGISQEAISFAGFHNLNKLILLYDSNNVTLDGPLSQSNSENVKQRFLASNWNVINVKDGNNIKEISKAIGFAKDSSSKPTLIILNTIIGYGSKVEGTHKVHGAPLGIEDGEYAKKRYNYEYLPFEIPDIVYENFKNTFISRSCDAYQKYIDLYDTYKINNPQLFEKFNTYSNNNIDKIIDELKYDISLFKDDSTRNVSGQLLNCYHDNLKELLIGGSADVAGSVKTALKNGINYSKEDRNGTNINWGIREFLMCAGGNGILLHGGLRTYLGSFLVFSDYAKGALRMASMMNLPQIYLFSHDSIAVGEDGPTHQPIEQIAMLRSIPNFNVIRPCDAKETYGAYKVALKSKHTPTAIILTRQTLPLLENSKYDQDFEKGAYIISKSIKEVPDLTLIATGSEVSLALQVKDLLVNNDKLNVDVVSMPSYNTFIKESKEYQESVIRTKRNNVFTIEMLSTFGWYRFSNHPYGIDTFGSSGNYKDLLKKFKFTKEDIYDFIKSNMEVKDA